MPQHDDALAQLLADLAAILSGADSDSEKLAAAEAFIRAHSENKEFVELARLSLRLKNSVPDPVLRPVANSSSRAKGH